MHFDDGPVGVALTRCYYCNEPSDILINKHLTTFAADKVRALHDRVVNMEPCSKCKELMAKGVVVISIRDGEKPPAEGEPPNPYRTGMFTVVSDAWIMRLIASGGLNAGGVAAFRQALARRFMFVQDSAYDALGLPRESTPETPPEV